MTTHTIFRPRAIAVASLALALTFAALATWQSARAATVTGTIAGFQYASPATVAPGDTITWTNSDVAPHTVTSRTAGVFDLAVAAGGSASMPAPAAGTYEIICTVHANMSGRLVVAAGSPSAPSTGSGQATAANSLAPLLILAAGLCLAVAAGSGALAFASKRS